jgi:hypothetical protein
VSVPRDPAARPRDQVRALSSAFLTRFFDNEIAGGSTDLRTSYFWLIAFLATPFLFFPLLSMGRWDFLAAYGGLEQLRVLSRADKTFILGIGMAMIGLITAVTWNSLLVDRRDGLVLGTLPVAGNTIVGAKLSALATYVAMTALAMHGLSSIAFGFLLASRDTMGFALAGVLAHLIATFNASLFVLLAVTAVQGVAFAVFGPRVFRRVSPICQMALIAGVLVSLALVPGIAGSAVDTLAGSGRHAREWILAAPPMWFLGVYEVILETDDPVLWSLAWRAAGGLALVTVVTLVSYPLAYRRLISTVVETPDEGRSGWSATVVEALARRVSVRPTTQACFQFFLASVGRVGSLRFVVAIGFGLTLATVLLALFSWIPRLHALPPRPTVGLMAVPVAAILFLLMSLRLAAAMPSDLRAAWIVASANPIGAELRSGLWRAMWLAAVLPVTIGVILVFAWPWGVRVAIGHAIVCGTIGAFVIELLLWRFGHMPCTRPWRPERANLRALWPAYSAGFLLITFGVTSVENRVLDSLLGSATLVCVLWLLTGAVHLSHNRRPPTPAVPFDEPEAREVLNLS